jgi:crotonobetainyl-CoA:carnitine CoA-transferase CaiB-like acyl-CoA transferase
VTGILGDIRVVDLSQGLAGPVATMILAECGADVVKVESPRGDHMRGTPAFATWNRSKRSVVLDLHLSEDRVALDRLLAGADVLVHSMRPAEARRHGLDDESLATAYPDLVVTGIGGWPSASPNADRPTFELSVMARSGIMAEQHGHRDGPVFIRFPLAGWGAAHLATVGILARLLARDRGAGGGLAATSLLQGALVPMTMHWTRAAQPSGGFLVGITGVTPLFECSDGRWVHLMACPDDVPLMRDGLVSLGEVEVAAANDAGPSYPVLPNFGANAVIFRRHDSATWLEALWADDKPVQPAQPLGQLFFDEQAAANDYLVEVDDPTYGITRQAAVPFTVSPGPTPQGPAPLLGEHTAAVLAEPPRPRPTRQVGQRGAGQRWPLEGVRVVDFGNFLAGPLAPMLMADLGADVVKVESITGDQMRWVGRAFAGCQRGKRSVAIDLRKPESRELVAALVRDADVVHHNLRMPAARKLGIDEATLRAIKPDLIYCHVSSYGAHGPRADWPGYDQLFQAAAGWEYEGAGEGNPPMWHRFGMMDHQCALASLEATLLALRHRDLTGEGQHVAASILGASLFTTSETFVGPDGTLAPFPRLDSAQTGLEPGYRIYPARDGWLALTATDPVTLASALAALSVTEPDQLADAVATRTRDEVLAALDAADVPAEPVVSDPDGASFLSDADNQAMGLAVGYPHAEWGWLEQVGALWDFGDLRTRIDRAPPALGQHTAEVLGAVGLSPAELVSLAGAGVIAGTGL